MRITPCRSGRGRFSGFTLVEMLVVLGIILVLVSILLPTVTAARRQARRTDCAARLRVIGQALQIYLTENNDVIPQACSTNSLESTQSRMGSNAVQLQPRSLFNGFMTNDPNIGPPGFALPLAPMPYYLRKGAPVSEKVWSCPALRTGAPGQFRTYQYVEYGRTYSDPDLLSIDSGPLAGVSGEFRPGYQFMGGAEYWWSIFTPRTDQQQISAIYHYRQFATRNIGGLRIDEIKPEGGQGTSDVVTFADYSVMAHSKETDDMWQSELSKHMGYYSANFLYLDGHVDYHEFKSVAGYFKVLHKPIPQTWGSGKIQGKLMAPDVWGQ